TTSGDCDRLMIGNEEKERSLKAVKSILWHTRSQQRQDKGPQQNHVNKITHFKTRGINVHVVIRDPEKGQSPLVRLSQTVRHPDGSVQRTQHFDISLDDLWVVTRKSKTVQPKQWFALAYLLQTLQTGAIVKIHRVFASWTKAELKAHNSPLFVIPFSFST